MPGNYGDCSRTPAPRRAWMTGAGAGLVRVEDGAVIRFTCAPTATFPARSAALVTSRGLILPSVDRYAH